MVFLLSDPHENVTRKECKAHSLLSSTVNREKFKIIPDCAKKFEVLNILFVRAAVMSAPSEDVWL